MYKYIIPAVVCLFLSACTATNPPETPEATGKWESLYTSVDNIMKGYK